MYEEDKRWHRGWLWSLYGELMLCCSVRADDHAGVRWFVPLILLIRITVIDKQLLHTAFSQKYTRASD